MKTHGNKTATKDVCALSCGVLHLHLHLVHNGTPACLWKIAYTPEGIRSLLRISGSGCLGDPLFTSRSFVNQRYSLLSLVSLSQAPPMPRQQQFHGIFLKSFRFSGRWFRPLPVCTRLWKEIQFTCRCPTLDLLL